MWTAIMRTTWRLDTLLAICGLCSAAITPLTCLGASPEVEAAITAVEKFGGVVTRALGAPDGPPVAIVLRNSNAPDVFLVSQLAHFKELRELDLENSAFTNAILRQIEAMPALTKLVLVGTKVERTRAEEMAKRKPNLKISWEHSKEGKDAALIEVRARELTVKETNLPKGAKRIKLELLKGSESSPNEPDYTASNALDEDDWARTVELFPDITDVILRTHTRLNAFYDDGEVRIIARLTQLEHLDIGNALLSAQGLAPLINHPTLKSLHFAARPFKSGFGLYGDEKTPVAVSSPLVLKTVKSVPHLEELILGFPTDAQLLGLRDAKNIRKLFILGKVTDVGLAVVGTMTNLEELHLFSHANYRPQVTDNLIPVVAKLPQLRSVTIRGCPFISFRGLSKLGTAKTLKNLDVADLAVTRQEFVQLLAQLQNSGIVLESARYRSEFIIGK